MRTLLVTILALLAAAAGVRADDDRERLANDQAQLFDRLSSLKKRMERLAGKLEQEGRVHKAELLRKAIAEVDGRNLESRRDEILRLVADTRSLQAHDRQQELLGDLEAILKLLQDEKELSDLEKELADLRETLASVRDLRNAERSLREKTEQLAGNEAQRLARLAQELAALLEKQQGVSGETRQDAEQSPPKTPQERAAERAAQQELDASLARLADEQRAVVEQLEAALEARGGDAEQVVEQAQKAAERGDAEALAEAARRVGEKRGELGGRPQVSEELLEALRELEQELSRAARGEPPATQQPGATPPLDQALAEAKRAVEQALEPPPATDATARGQRAELEQLAAKEGALAPEATELAARDPASAEDLQKAAQALAEAQEKLAEAMLSEGLEPAREALERLEAAQEASARRAAAAERAERQLANRQDFLRAEAEAARKDAGAITPSEGQRSLWSQAKQGVEQALDRAAESMKQAAEQLAQGGSEQAQPPQSEAEQALEQALEQVQQAAEQAKQQAAQQDPAQAQARMDQLADEQQAIEEKLRDLMQRMRDKKQKNGQEQGGAAQRAMERARQQLDDGEAEQAEQAEREAEKSLQEMEKKLREEENRYENLRSEEVLFRMKERLQDLRKRAAALHEGIVQVETDRAGAERLSRRLRPRVEGLSKDASAIQRDNDEVRSKLAEEESPTFPWVLEKNGADLGQLAAILGDRDADTGTFTQVLADDVITRYERLLQALDEELKRRAEAMKNQQQDGEQQPQQQQGEQRPSLVPPVAELILLKNLEQDVLEDVKTMRVEQRDADPALLDARLKLLERLGHRHSELTEMFDELVRQQSEPDGEGEEDAPAEPGTEGGQGENK